jgi:hypothetical protein
MLLLVFFPLIFSLTARAQNFTIPSTWTVSVDATKCTFSTHAKTTFSLRDVSYLEHQQILYTPTDASFG